MPVTREVALRNRILTRLSAEALDRLLPHLREFELTVPTTLYEPGTPIEYVYFPLSGLVSLVSLMRDGSVIEIGAVGAEGATGTSTLMGQFELPYRHLAQIRGNSARIGASTLLPIAAEVPELQKVLLRYHGSAMVQTMQNAACNGLHNVEQRCCKWLLLTQDRLGQDRLELTHEFLGQMLGVRRASVSEVLKPLRDEGLLDYTRGAVVIQERAGLEERACECYRVVAEEFSWLDR